MRAATLVCSIRGLSLRVSNYAVNDIAFDESDTCRVTIDTRGRKTTYGKFALAKNDILSLISQMFNSLLANTQQILPQASKPDLACFVSSDRACGGNLMKLFSSILRSPLIRPTSPPRSCCMTVPCPRPKLTDRAYVRKYGVKLPAPSGYSHVSNCALTGSSNSLRASFSLVLKLAVSTSEVPPSLILQADTPLQLLPLSYFLIHILLLSTLLSFTPYIHHG